MPQGNSVRLQSGIRIFYREWNKAGTDTVVTLHGIGCTGAFWKSLPRHIPRRHRIVAPDLRGHGESSKSAGGYDFETLSLDLDELLESLSLAGGDQGTPIALVGHSWGAFIAVAYASKFPRKVGRLILVDGAIGDSKGLRWMSKEEYLNVAETPPEWLESIQDYRKGIRGSLGFWNSDMRAAVDTTVMVDPQSGRVMEKTPTSVAKLILEELWNFRLRTYLPKLSNIPVLLTMADSDTVRPRRLVRRWRKESISTWNRYVDDFRTVSFPNTSHYIMLQRRREFGTIVARFIDHS
jgi:pimeloyl-ACP methyl ester carboxylesterase